MKRFKQLGDDSEWELFILRFNELKALSGEKERK